MRRLVLLAAGALVVGLLASSGSSAAPTQQLKLVGTVGPDFNISLVDAQGARVTKLEPGTYEIEVTDRSDFHNFHLQGPGVNETTGVEFTGETTWQVTFKEGVYTFLCDVHPTSMRGTFTVGAPPSTPTAPAARKKLVLTSGPGYTITLKTAAGKAVRSLKLGSYTVVVHDRSSIHDAHIVAPGYNRRTTVPFVGTQTWKMKLAKTGTLRFLCDPHASQGMRGSARIVS
jgi:plastocyanin